MNLLTTQDHLPKGVPDFQGTANFFFFVTLHVDFRSHQSLLLLALPPCSATELFSTALDPQRRGQVGGLSKSMVFYSLHALRQSWLTA